MSHSTLSRSSPPYVNDTSSSATSGEAEAGSAFASGASTTSGTLSRISSIRRSEARPEAHMLESIVIMTSGVMVVRR